MSNAPSPLRAAFDGDIDVVRAALDDGLDVDHANAKGMTLLMMACWEKGQPAVVNLLLERGADVHARQESSAWTALTFAAVNNHPALVETLVRAGAHLDHDNDWKALAFSVQYRSHDGVEALLTHGAPDLDACGDDGRTPLMRAARNSDVAMIARLLEAGAAVTPTDTDGRTALHHAATKANVDNVRALLDAGADASLTDDAGDTALAIAQARKKPNARIVALLSG